jgi:hypothetical protein
MDWNWNEIVGANLRMGLPVWACDDTSFDGPAMLRAAATSP